VLRSDRAVQMSIAIVCTFVRMRELMAANKEIAARVEKLERGHDRTASVIEVLVEDIDHLAREVKEMKALPPVTKRVFPLKTHLPLLIDADAVLKLAVANQFTAARLEWDRATNPSLCKWSIAEGLAEQFPYARGWVHQRIDGSDSANAIGMFKRN
jgi:hypothetical protein